ncbi:hypothetical protein GH714_002719 [Hevea brasiliensis]|uniref:Uncharacterized protein n=1 Tax=Hevea brasiliensis TaxID=3981 RepID=A0A6A6LBC6_HEVBR|nr:hypothetical protein GH714_002719 [Hevea brasiliensis]
MAKTLDGTKSTRIAIVTGDSKGIGFEICRQLASKGIMLSPNERARKVLGDADGLTEEKVEKAALNACTRVLANKYPRIAINAVNTGFTKTDLNGNTGVLPVEKGAKGPVMLALAPDAGPSCVYFDRTEISTS